MKSGFIPSKRRDHETLGEISYQARILHRSAELGHGIEPDDFIEKPADQQAA
jgi:hypothetical protein